MLDTVRTVLIVDDDPMFRRFVAASLATKGISVKEARNTIEGERLLLESPDLLMVDYKLPQTDGASWIRKLKEDGIAIPIVFCSGSGYDSKVFSVVRNVLSVDSILQKPVSSERLTEAIVSLLPQSRFDPVSVPGPPQAASLLTEAAGSGKDGVSVSDWMETYASEEDQETRRMLEALARDYVANLPRAIDEIAGEICRLGLDESAELLETVSNRAHQIRGTGSSLGFCELGVLAGELEDRLNGLVAVDREWLASWREELLVFVDLMRDVVDNLVGQYVLTRSSERDEAESVAIAAFKTEGRSESSFDREASPDCEPVQVRSTLSRLARSVTPLRVLMVLNPSAKQTALAQEQAIEDVLRRLSGFGQCQVQTLYSALSMMSCLNDGLPDLILMEADLPGLTGFEACRMLRAHPRWVDLPILLLLKSNGGDERRQVYESGASDFAFLPILEEELQARMRSVLPEALKNNLPSTIQM